MVRDPQLELVLAAFGRRGARLERITMGNINWTYRVHGGDEQWILQQLNPIFGPEVHHDIEAVTRHLEARGLMTPRLIPTKDGQLWTVDSSGAVWRLMTWISGRVVSEDATPELCESAGELLGRFHLAVADLRHRFCHVRPVVHDTERHLAHLRKALDAGRDHPRFVEAAEVGDAILAAMAEVGPLGELPRRVVHGDPKLNNIVFSTDGRARALIDLDTLSRMTIPVELGDAFRSWCNPAGEDRVDTRFDATLFAASLVGYSRGVGDLLTAAERAAIPAAVERITLELAARFCVDVLEESYFGWDPERFPTAAAHHLCRARGQLQLARSVATQRAELRCIVASELGVF